MLIDQHGNKEGIVTIEEAMRKAELSSLDLVQVTPNDANPIVCKIMENMFSQRKRIFNLQIQRVKKRH